MTRTHLDVNAQIRYVTMQTGSGEMAASPETQRSLRAGWCMLGVLRPSRMSRDCEGTFFRVSAATTKTLLQCAPTKDFARARAKDCTRSRTSHGLKVIRMCTRPRLAAAARNSFLFHLVAHVATDASFASQREEAQEPMDYTR